MFPIRQKRVIPGQYVKVQLLLEEQPNTLVVPQQAIGEQQGILYVYVVWEVIIKWNSGRNRGKQLRENESS